LAHWTVRNPGGAPPGSAWLPGRGYGRVRASASALAPVRSIQIRSIVQCHYPLLTRLHFLGFHVSGWFTFVYPRGGAGNNEHASGYHRIAIIVRRCGGRWGIDPNWLEAGGGKPFAWI